MNLNPPVNKFSEPEEIREWLGELENLREDPELQDLEHQAELRRHWNDARTWLEWDLHGKVVEEGRDTMEVLQEVGALTREPGDPPPSEAAE